MPKPSATFFLTSLSGVEGAEGAGEEVGVASERGMVGATAWVGTVGCEAVTEGVDEAAGVDSLRGMTGATDSRGTLGAAGSGSEGAGVGAASERGIKGATEPEGTTGSGAALTGEASASLWLSPRALSADAPKEVAATLS